MWPMCVSWRESKGCEIYNFTITMLIIVLVKTGKDKNNKTFKVTKGNN